MQAIRDSVGNNPRKIIPNIQADIIKLTHTIFRDNRDRLEQVFGPPACYFTVEFRYHVWLLRYQPLPDFHKDYFVFSAKAKGTSIEALKSDIEIDTQFIFRLYEELKDDTGGDTYCWGTDVVGKPSLHLDDDVDFYC